MKITGLTRRVDSLGRIVIPKELRRMLHIKEGSPLEIYMDADETIVLKKYSQVGSLKNMSQAYAQSLSKVTGATVCVADRDEIIAAAGKNHKNYIGKALSKELENIMDKEPDSAQDQNHSENCHFITSGQLIYRCQKCRICHGNSLSCIRPFYIFI